MIKLFLVLFIYISSLNASNAQRLVWPAAPDEAKIEYVKTITKAKDVGIVRGFFSSIYNFVFGEEDPILSYPFGIHVEKSRIYVTDVSAKMVYIFDKKKNKEISIDGSDDESFAYPIDVVTDRLGNIYVSDSVKAKVYVFEEDGSYLYTINPKSLQRPVGLAIDNNTSRLYIVDAMASQIHITELNGKFIKSIGHNGSGKGELNRPTFIDISKDGNLYISDSMNHRVQVLDGDGNYINSFGGLSQYVGGFGNPRGIALDSDENVYVSDTMYNTLQIFNKKGELLMVFGGYGSRAGEFSLPEDISISSNKIYVTDTNNKRVQLFKLIDKTNKGVSK